MMYLVSATLKRYEDQGRIREDLPLVRWSVRDALYHAQQAIDQILSNFPVKALATLLRWTVFPLGTPFRPPLDSRNHECARIALEPGAARDRLTAGMLLRRRANRTPPAQLEAAFLATIACEPIEKKLREAVKSRRARAALGRRYRHPRAGTATSSAPRSCSNGSARKRCARTSSRSTTSRRTSAAPRSRARCRTNCRRSRSRRRPPDMQQGRSTSSTARARRSSSRRTGPARSPPPTSPRRPGARCSRASPSRRGRSTR